MTTRDRLCPDCGSEWTPSLKSSFCPDCGAALDGSGRRKEFETTLEASSASELPHRRREGPESTPALREVRYTLSELKRHRNPAGLERLAEAFVQTQLLFGTNVYEAACGPQLKDHAWATTSLLDDDDPKLVVPLRRVIPITDAKGKTLEEAVRDQSDKALDDGILQGGLLVTGHERVVFGWQQFRAGGWGKVGVCGRVCVGRFLLGGPGCLCGFDERRHPDLGQVLGNHSPQQSCRWEQAEAGISRTNRAIHP